MLLLAVRRQNQQQLLLQCGCQYPTGDWSSYRLSQPISNHTARTTLAAALQAKDPNASRHEVARAILTAARHAQELSPGSQPLVQKSRLPPAVNSPAARAAYASLFSGAYLRLPPASSGFVVLVMRGCWVQAADCGRLTAAAFGYNKDGYEYAVSQLHVRSAASSPAMARLLLGPSALDGSCLRWVLGAATAATDALAFIKECACFVMHVHAKASSSKITYTANSVCAHLLNPTCLLG